MEAMISMTGGVEEFSENLTEQIEQLGSMTAIELLESFKQFFILESPRILKTIVFFVIAYILLLSLLRIMRKVLGRSKVDATLHPFILSTTKIVLMVVIGICCAGLLGIQLMPLVAALGTLGLALSLAVKDSLANVAGGIAVLFSRPFTIGDYVEIGDQLGTVTELGLVYTQLLTLDNKTVYLPNGDVAKATIVNYSAQPVRRLDLIFPIRDGNDYPAIRAMIFEIINKAPLALKDPAPLIRMTDQSVTFVKMTVMVWVNTPDLPELRNYLIQEIRAKLTEFTGGVGINSGHNLLK